MSGPPPKPPDRRQRRGRNDAGALAIPTAAQIPAPPPGLLGVTKKAWQAFWAAPTAALVVDSDRTALDRLFSLYDEHTRLWRAARRRRLVDGSQGQPVLNPLYRQADTLRAEILALEDRFGLSPMARLKLGAALGEARRSLADELAAEAEMDFDEGDDPDVVAIDA